SKSGRSISWNGFHGIHGQKQFARTNSTSVCWTVLDDIEEHPTLAVIGIDCAQCGVNRMSGRHVGTADVEKSRVAAAEGDQDLSLARLKLLHVLNSDEIRRALVEKRGPISVIL